MKLIPFIFTISIASFSPEVWSASFTKNETYEICKSKFISMGYKVAQKINEKNISNTPLTPRISGYSFLKALNPDDIINIDDTEPLNYKGAPVDVLFDGTNFKVRCNTILKVSEKYLFGLVAHEIFRKMDVTNNTLFEGDEYGLSRQLSGEHLELSQSPKDPYYSIRQDIINSDYNEYYNTCRALVLSPEGSPFDQQITLTEYRNKKNQTLTLLSYDVSDEKSDLKAPLKLEVIPLSIARSLKEGNKVFNLITQFSKENQISSTKIQNSKYENAYNLNDDVFLDCDQDIFN